MKPDPVSAVSAGASAEPGGGAETSAGASGAAAVCVSAPVSGSAGATQAAPRFLLPAALTPIEIESCYPESAIDGVGDHVSPQFGLGRLPLLVALARTTQKKGRERT